MDSSVCARPGTTPAGEPSGGGGRGVPRLVHVVLANFRPDRRRRRRPSSGPARPARAPPLRLRGPPAETSPGLTRGGRPPPRLPARAAPGATRARAAPPARRLFLVRAGEPSFRDPRRALEAPLTRRSRGAVRGDAQLIRAPLRRLRRLVRLRRRERGDARPNIPARHARVSARRVPEHLRGPARRRDAARRGRAPRFARRAPAEPTSGIAHSTFSRAKIRKPAR